MEEGPAPPRYQRDASSPTSVLAPRHDATRAPPEGRPASSRRDGGMGLAAYSASADAPIEGVWSFNGGRVAIKEQATGTFVGTVVSPTKFAQCTHPVGEDMWTQLAPQGDGSYWGLHQWFFDSEECVAQSAPGPDRLAGAAERRGAHPSGLLQRARHQLATDDRRRRHLGERHLRMRRLGADLRASRDHLGPAREIHKPPGGGACVDRRRLRIRLRDPKNDPLAKIVVTLRSGSIHRARVTRGNGRPSPR